MNLTDIELRCAARKQEAQQAYLDSAITFAECMEALGDADLEAMAAYEALITGPNVATVIAFAPREAR